MSRFKSQLASPTSTKLASLVLAPILALCGCSAIQVKLGMKVYVAQLPIATMQASLPKDPGIAPGEKSPLVVTFTQPDGRAWMTEGAGKGKILWSDIAITTSVVSAGKKGVLSLPRDPRLSDGKTGHVIVTVPSHPDLRAELDIPLRYNYKFVSNFSGSSGSSGINDSDGTAGASGSTGSMDPDQPSVGGNGSDGTNGSDGQDGGAGGDASSVDIRVTLRSAPHPLLQAVVFAPGHKQRFYLVDPQGGSLTVTADGGPGGSGGKGGRGGRGGSGGIGTPNGSSGLDGTDGRNGFDGSQGRGGHITVTYDPQVKPFLNLIRLSNRGGPPPQFNEEPVTPLW